ncbi:uncharacterized protein MELLADRAFT_114698 [Melampsora larici-populina 98AG31]|uniref:DUF7872 domain-containing protein n=1 Tax=Melampsora larici-populina (strain 98AG31 / pathotype 3-4-7) TaxID=747676 RepID=F4SEF3_MELLP|nr:uncharacterized protein MELLADRAFT_114698 [Melampsora larici-populina 98AG31]EGF96973.1 hypothetical protein MELLADRAFT_114698 [Melampsora larici-populina 98AG31]
MSFPNNNGLGGYGNSRLPSFGQFPPLDRQCKAMPMEEATWKTLQMDDYMQKLPDGNTMSLEAFAVKMNYTNFICGIGASCWAGQPCYPLGLKDFYILYSVQQYNTYMNIYADAVGYGIGLVQSTINALIASLFPAQDTTMIKNMKANMGVQAAFSQVTGAVLLDLFTALTAATGPIGMAFNVLGQVIVAGMATVAVVIQEPPGPLKDGFDQWSNVAYYLTQYQQLLRKQIDDTLKKRIQSGISTDEGMFGVIKGGTFLPPAQMINLPDFTDRVRNITTAMGINLILNRSGCQEKGLNGASEDPSRISYCRKPGGTMYNLFISHGDDAFWQIENGQVIQESFGYSPELIIMSSVRCQKLNRGYRYSPWADGKSTPQDVTDTCVFNLPVCFLDHKDTRDRISRDHKRFSPGKACKMEGMPLI